MRRDRNGSDAERVLAETDARLRLPPCLCEWWRVPIVVALFEVHTPRPLPSPAAPSHLRILAFSAPLRTLPVQQGMTPSTSQHPTLDYFQKEKKELTGTCCPGDHQAEGGTGSSADDRRDMPTWPARQGACVPTWAKQKPTPVLHSCYPLRTQPERRSKMTGEMRVTRAG